MRGKRVGEQPKKVGKINQERERLNEIISKLDEIYIKCCSIKEEFRLDSLNQEKLNNIKNDVSECGKTFDRILEEILDQGIEDKKILTKSMRTQGIISRLAHKIQRKKFEFQEDNLKERLKEGENNLNGIKLEFDKKEDSLKSIAKDIEGKGIEFTNKAEKLEETSQKLQTETSTIKESILTITSLIFTAFTFIQINFIAFQNAVSYTIWDRLILFAVINIFVILGIYTIFSLIRTIILRNDYIHWNLKFRIGIPLFLLLITFMYSLNKKYELEKEPLYHDKIAYYNKLIQKEKEITNKLNEKLVELNSQLGVVNEEILIKKQELATLNAEVIKFKEEFNNFITLEKEKILEETTKELKEKLIVQKNKL